MCLVSGIKVSKLIKKMSTIDSTICYNYYIKELFFQLKAQSTKILI